VVVADERFLIELKATGNAEEAFENLGKEVRDTARRIDTESRKAGRDYDRFTDKAVRDSNRLERSVKGVGFALTGLGVAAAGLGAAYAVVSQAIDLSALASEAEETQSKFDTLFDGLEERANGLALGLAESLGRAPTDIQDAIAGFQALLTPMGLVNEEGLEISSTLTRLGLDLSSFFNTAEDDAFLALRSALIGETEPLRRYGVNLLDVRVRQEAVRLGLAETSAAADDQARVLARLSLILGDTDKAQGDLIRTQDSFANSLRGLRSQLRGAQIEAGQRINEAVLQGIEDAGGVERITQLFEVGFETIADLTRVGISGLVEFASTGLEVVDRLGGPEGVARVVAGTADLAIAQIRFFGAEAREQIEPLVQFLDDAGVLAETAFGRSPGELIKDQFSLEGPSLQEQVEQARELQERIAAQEDVLRGLAVRQANLFRENGGQVSQAATALQLDYRQAFQGLENAQRLFDGLPDVVLDLVAAQDGLAQSLAPLGEQAAEGIVEGAENALAATDFSRIAEGLGSGLFGRQSEVIAGQGGERAGQAYAEGIARYLNAIGPEVFAAGQNANFLEEQLALQLEIAELTNDQQFILDAEIQGRLDRVDAMLHENAILDDQAEKLRELIQQYGSLRNAQEGVGGELTQFGDSLDRISTNALAGFIQGGEQATRAAEQFQRALQNLLAERAAEFIFDLILPGGFGSIFGFAGGGVVQGPSTALGALPLNFYAGGGIVDSPQLFVAGEGQSAEAIVPMPNGAVPVQFTNGGGGGGGNTVVVNLNVSALDGQDAARVLQGQLGTIQAAVIEGLQGGNRGLIESVRGVNA